MPDHPPEVQRRHTALSNASVPRSMFRRRTMDPSHRPTSGNSRQERYSSYNDRLTWEDLGGYLEGIWPGWKMDKANVTKSGDYWVFNAPRPLTPEDRQKIAAIRDMKPLSRRPSFSDEES